MDQHTGAAATYISKLVAQLQGIDRAQIDNAVSLVERAWKDGRQIITLGNGGSAVTALHYITDWNKSIFLRNKRSFRGRTLVDNVGLLMAYANDISFMDIFSEQLKNIMEHGDLVIAISGSGNSENVIRAVDYANDHGGITLGLCGYRGGRLKERARHVLWVDIDDMQVVEDIHAMFGHIVMQRLCGTI